MPNAVNMAPIVGRWICSAFIDFTAKYAINIVNGNNPAKVVEKLTKYCRASVT